MTCILLRISTKARSVSPTSAERGSIGRRKRRGAARDGNLGASAVLSFIDIAGARKAKRPIERYRDRRTSHDYKPSSGDRDDDRPRVLANLGRFVHGWLPSVRAKQRTGRSLVKPRAPRADDFVRMKICGPKYALCGLVLSVWGIFQLVREII